MNKIITIKHNTDLLKILTAEEATCVINYGAQLFDTYSTLPLITYIFCEYYAEEVGA